MSEFLKGMDISSLTEVESLGGRFFSESKAQDLFTILGNHGVNAIRLRLWNDPFGKDGEPYQGGFCDLDSIVNLAKRVQAHKMKILLDFHYSDFWADPGKQFKPKAWAKKQGLELEKAVETYTESVLKRFKHEGIFLDFVQIGNEITNGMLWPEGKLEVRPEGGPRSGYDRLARLIRAGITAVKKVSPKTKIMLHLERSGDNAVYREWLEEILIKEKIDFDILGVSYYVYWHGPFDLFKRNMRDILTRYHKPICIVETSYGFTGKDYEKEIQPENYTGLVMTDDKLKLLKDQPPFALTHQGQNDFVKELLGTIDDLGLLGFFYWEPAWLPLKGSSWASKEAVAYIHETKGTGNEWANQGLFDYHGNALPALNLIRDFHPKGEK